jgi:REP element-mobilizing transposase RayT
MAELSASRRLRIGRCSERDRIYLLTTDTLDREPLFADFALGRLVVHQFRRTQELGLANSLAWVAMPDHFHWLIELKNCSLRRLLGETKSLAAREVNRCTGTSGPIWQQGYHDRALRMEDDLVKMARYVVANPLRAGLVAKMGDYPQWDAVWL